MNEDLQQKKYKKIRMWIQIVIILILIGLAIYATIRLYPIYKRVQDDVDYRDMIVEKIRGFGGFAWAIIIAIQIIQTVLAVIPGGPVVIITGMLYSPWIAVLISLAGQTLGVLVVIGLVKLFGNSFMSLFVDPEQPKKFKLLEDGKRCGVLMFSYLLIPVLPKDPIAFIVPFTKLKTRYFIIINLVARTPMTIVSVIFGNSIISGNITVGLIIGCISAALAFLCFIFNKKIVSFLDKIMDKKKAEPSE